MIVKVMKGHGIDLGDVLEKFDIDTCFTSAYVYVSKSTKNIRIVFSDAEESSSVFILHKGVLSPTLEMFETYKISDCSYHATKLSFNEIILSKKDLNLGNDFVLVKNKRINSRPIFKYKKVEYPSVTFSLAGFLIFNVALMRKIPIRSLKYMNWTVDKDKKIVHMAFSAERNINSRTTFSNKAGNGIVAVNSCKLVAMYNIRLDRYDVKIGRNNTCSFKYEEFKSKEK